MTFDHSHPGLFQEKSQLAIAQKAKMLRHIGGKCWGTHCRGERSLVSSICLSAHPASSSFQFIFTREWPFLGKRLDSALEEPNAAHMSEGFIWIWHLKKPFGFLLTAACKTLTALIFFGNSSISFRSQSLSPVSSPSLCDQSRDEREVWLSPDWKALSAVSNASSSPSAPCCTHLSLQLIYEL